VFAPVSITQSAAYSVGASGTAIHQLPSMISKPKVIVTNGTQVVLNGPSSFQALSNGASHLEIKKDPSSQNPGNDWCFIDVCFLCVKLEWS